MLNGNNKHELFDNFKFVAEAKGWFIKEEKDISYGIQFKLIANNMEGLVRIFEGKKGVRFDLSQIKNPELLLLIEKYTLSKKQVTISNGGETSKQSSNLEEFPDEIIGTDESGKGDFFGPLVIGGVYVNKKTTKALKDLGIMDSKKLSDLQISKLAPEIKKLCSYSVVVIGNKKYNQLYDKMHNLNKLLAWGHARVIENLLVKTDCQYALSDQFGDEKLIQQALMDKGKSISLFQRHKAEKIIAVAAASIIARDEYVKRLTQLSTEYKLALPKGASNKTISVAKQFLVDYSKDELVNIAKLHFKTTQQL